MSVAAADPAESPERKPWSSGMAPAYIGTFLWVAFFDGLGRRALAVGGLLPTLGGVAAAAALAYLLLYRGPAEWGFATRRPLDDLLGSTFGRVGALVVPNLLAALAQVALFAAGIGYATDLTLGGLLTLGLVDPRVVRPIAWLGATVPAPLFLTVALAWGTVTALVGMGIVRWIAAIMQYFPVFPAAALALAVAGTYSGLPNFRPTHVDPSTELVVAANLGASLAFLASFQWTFGFAALLGLAGADWGAASPSRADVRTGGFVGIFVAPVVVASLALLAVAGHEGKLRERAEAIETAPATVAEPEPIESPPGGGPFAFRAAVEGGLDRRVAATVLIVFGLASLAPACYAAFDFSRRITRVAPGLSRVAATLVGVAAGWLLIVAGWSERTDLLFTILGAVFAPVAGALTADSARRRPEAGVTRAARINAAGLLAWTIGATVGFLPWIGRATGQAALARIPVPALLAFIAAVLAYRVAGAVGLEPRSTAPAQQAA